MKNPPPSRIAERIIIRLPDGMRDRLHARAEANGRSMTAEVVALLKAGLDGGATLHVDALTAEYERLKHQSQLIAAALAETDARQEVVWRELQAIASSGKGDVAPDELKNRPYSLSSILTRGMDKSETSLSEDNFIGGSYDLGPPKKKRR